MKVDIYARFNMKAQRMDDERGRQPRDRDLVDRRLSASDNKGGITGGICLAILNNRRTSSV
jgi:hypothetical protein